MNNDTQNESPVVNNALKSRLTTVTPLSKYLAMTLFILLPFLGGWIGYTYAPQKVVEVEKVVIKEARTIGDSTLQENSPNTEAISYASSTQKILATYLSPININNFPTTYSGLEDDEIGQVNQIISLANKQATYTKEEIEAANATYNELFVDSIDERVQDAPSARANELIGMKTCVAVSMISNNESEAVKNCVGEDAIPTDIKWSTDDITAVAQIAPYYLTGSHYFNQDKSKDLARYYLEQILLHQETAIERWGQEYFEGVAGDDYFTMVADARDKLQLLNE